jgi:Zn-dependent membrane protease YugP
VALYPGTGAELARHLLDRFDMKHIKVETTERGDHYDPETKAVRLTPDKFSGKSLTAVTVAAHEVGHAIQDHTGYSRSRSVRGSCGSRTGRKRSGRW